MAVKKTTEWEIVEDPIVDGPSAAPKTPLATFGAPGQGGPPNTEKQVWRGMSLTDSHWKGYQVLAFLTAEKAVMAQIELHQSTHSLFQKAVDRLKEGLPHTIKLSERAQMEIDGKTSTVKSITLQPMDGRIRMQILGSGYLDVWSGNVEAEPFVKALEKTTLLMSKQSETAPRRALRSPEVSSKTMPDAWVKQQERLDHRAGRKLDTPISPLGVTGKMTALYEPLLATPPSPRGSGGYAQRSPSGLHYPLKSIAADINGRPVSALDLEIRLDEWPPLISLQYAHGVDRRLHVVELTAGDLAEMRRTIDDKVWSLRQSGDVTLSVAPSLRGVMYEEIRKAILDFKPGLETVRQPVRMTGEPVLTPVEKVAPSADQFSFG